MFQKFINDFNFTFTLKNIGTIFARQSLCNILLDGGMWRDDNVNRPY